ncbi:MAG: CBS domain-containing protein [Balneolales bacterium]
MLVLEIINIDILPLRVADSAQTALSSMKEYKVDELPIVDHTTRKLIGMVSKESLMDNESGKVSLFAVRRRKPITTSPDEHVFDVAKTMMLNNLKLIPVVDEKENFLGVVLRSELYKALSEMLNVSEHGSVITIEQQEHDFSLSEVVRIIESENAKILGIAVQPPNKISDHFRLSIKLNLTDLSRVKAALSRYNFIIIQDSGNTQTDSGEYEDRADEFIRFLDL